MLYGKCGDVVAALPIHCHACFRGEGLVVVIQGAASAEAAEDDAEIAGEEAQAYMEGVEGVLQGENGGDGLDAEPEGVRRGGKPEDEEGVAVEDEAK